MKTHTAGISYKKKYKDIVFNLASYNPSNIIIRGQSYAMLAELLEPGHEPHIVRYALLPDGLETMSKQCWTIWWSTVN
jgi:hypothetical protein